VGAIWYRFRAELRLRWRAVWQATTLVAVALVVAVPAGLVVGRVSWRIYARGLGVKPETAFPWIGLGAVVVAVLLVANLIAIVPGMAAARTRPATVLRSE
jgi:putative ABC transport system permease protein